MIVKVMFKDGTYGDFKFVVRAETVNGVQLSLLSFRSTFVHPHPLATDLASAKTGVSADSMAFVKDDFMRNGNIPLSGFFSRSHI
jgi:hypothetical protein